MLLAHVIAKQNIWMKMFSKQTRICKFVNQKKKIKKTQTDVLAPTDSSKLCPVRSSEIILRDLFSVEIL